jgi:hypothetical protein
MENQQVKEERKERFWNVGKGDKRRFEMKSKQMNNT